MSICIFHLPEIFVGLTGDEFHQTNRSYQESIYVCYVSTRFAIMCYW
jgi:hypothetical protein